MGRIGCTWDGVEAFWWCSGLICPCGGTFRIPLNIISNCFFTVSATAGGPRSIIDLSETLNEMKDVSDSPILARVLFSAFSDVHNAAETISVSNNMRGERYYHQVSKAQGIR